MNVWQLITQSSTLPIQAGNNLWNHINNLGAGSGGETIFVTKLFADVKKTTVAGIVKETSLVKGGVIEKTVLGTVSTTNTTGEITSSNLTGKL